MFRVKGQRSRSQGQTAMSQRYVTYEQWKRYKTASDRLSDFKLGMDVVIKADDDWRCLGRPGVAM